jgi:hypothetical protein
MPPYPLTLTPPTMNNDVVTERHRKGSLCMAPVSESSSIQDSCEEAALSEIEHLPISNADSTRTPTHAAVTPSPPSSVANLLTLLETGNQRWHVESSGGASYLFVVDVVEAPLRYSYTQDAEVAFSLIRRATQPFTIMVSSCFLVSVQYMYVL